ncbi:MAG: hypothetical protein KF744_15225 [Taibaiella sp.]|nr:hypothetical protein [Taibaiella sp.]
MKKITKNCDFHYDLHFADPNSEFVLAVGTQRIPLKAHTPESRLRAKGSNAALALVPEHNITHYAENVPVSQSAPQIIRVLAKEPLPGQTLPPMLFAYITLPSSASDALLEHRLKAIHPYATKRNAKLSLYGINTSLADAPQVIKDSKLFINASDTATTLPFMHNELLNNGSAVAAIILNHIENAQNFSNLVWQLENQMKAFHAAPSATNNWTNQAPILDYAGNPIPGQYTYTWSPTTTEWASPLLLEVLATTKNDPDLESSTTVAGCYSVQNGIVSQGVSSTSTLVADAAPATSSLALNNLTVQNGVSVVKQPALEDGKFAISFSNNYIRWLGVYVEFYDASGNLIEPDGWVSPEAVEIYSVWDSPTQKIVALVSSVNTILGVPLGGSQYDVDFKWPDNASSVTISAGGLGRSGGIMGANGVYYGGWDTSTCLLGTVMTCTFNMALPTVSLVAGAIITASEATDLVKATRSTIVSMITTLINGEVSTFLQGDGLSNLVVGIGNFVINLFLTSTTVEEWVAKIIGEAVAKEAVPIVGEIVFAIGVAADTAVLAQTAVEVAVSPCIYEYQVFDTIDASWELLPDVNHGNTWPLEATHYQVEAIYKNGTSRCMLNPGVLSTGQTGPITASLNGLPGQVQVQFRATFYSDSGWIAGVAQTDWMAAIGNNGSKLVLPATNITENQIPLTASTQYQYVSSLAYDNTSQSRSWNSANGRPVATIANLNGSNSGNNLGDLLNISNNIDASVLGYAYTASGQNIPLEGGTTPSNAQMSVFQSISSYPNNPDTALCFSPYGFESQTALAIDPSAPASPGPVSFYVDPAAFNIRPVAIGSTGTFDMNTGSSYGQFSGEVNACAYHPAGYIIGVSTAENALQVVNVANGIASDNEAPLAEVYGGYGTRPGKLHSPIAVAAAPHSALIVLENSGIDPVTNAPFAARLQAFDLNGNPANIFGGNTSNVAELNPEGSSTVMLLDLAVETTGFIYVLKVVGDTNVAANYILDIYNPDGEFLCQTTNFTTSKISVDTWRTLYSLDYAMLPKTDGTRTEPGVSIWTPSVPQS